MMKLIESRFLRSNDHSRMSIAPRGCLDGDFSVLEVVVLLNLLRYQIQSKHLQNV